MLQKKKKSFPSSYRIDLCYGQTVTRPNLGESWEPGQWEVRTPPSVAACSYVGLDGT